MGSMSLRELFQDMFGDLMQGINLLGMMAKFKFPPLSCVEMQDFWKSRMKPHGRS